MVGRIAKTCYPTLFLGILDMDTYIDAKDWSSKGFFEGFSIDANEVRTIKRYRNDTVILVTSLDDGPVTVRITAMGIQEL